MLLTLTEAEASDIQRLMGRWSADELADVGTGLIDFYARLEETKTDVLKAIAKVVVILRSKFRTPDGEVDWAGRSWDYRQTVTSMYERSGVPPDSEQNIQASLRYHVGNLLREVVPAKELEAVGLRTDSPKERMNAQRVEARALVAEPSIATGSRHLDAFDRQLQGVVALSNLLASMPVDALAELNLKSLDHFARMLREAISHLVEVDSRVSRAVVDRRHHHG